MPEVAELMHGVTVCQLVLVFCNHKLSVNVVLSEADSDVLCEESNVVHHASCLIKLITISNKACVLISHQIVLFVVLLDCKLLYLVLCQELFL